ncbi:MAG TPA: PQQ-binding-like beta-propeller repeat protein [Pirellulaceae bacterium]|nr:PQQ-binding-like beta-propeller repeat protein [Pirellulaceae bacterium]
MLQTRNLLLIIVLTTLFGCANGDSTTINHAASQMAATEPNTQIAASAIIFDGPTDLWTRKKGVDWPDFLGPNRDSKSSETGIISPWPEAGLKIVWQRELQTGYGIGSISKGRMYQFERQDNQATLLCLVAETGEELWRFQYPTDYEDLLGYNNGPRCSPVIDGDRVYIYGAEGMLHCLQAVDGKLVWKLDVNAKYGVAQNFFGVGSTPVVEGDLLICMVGGSPPGSPGLYESGGQIDGNGTGVVAFNKFTGEAKYEITDELASYSSPQLATIHGRRWCFMFARGGVVGFEPASGKVDFQYPWRSPKLESVNAATPVVVGNEVFISETYSIGSSLLAVKPGGYDLVWADDPSPRKPKAMLAHWNTGIYLAGYLYGCSGRNPPDADLRCIDWKTGKVQWVEQLPPETRERSSLLYVDGHFVELGEYGILKLLRANPKKYELVSEMLLLREQTNPAFQPRPLLKHPAWAAPILSHGLLYVRGDDRLVCLELIPD